MKSMKIFILPDVESKSKAKMQIWLEAEVWCSSIDSALRMKVYSGVEKILHRDEKFSDFYSVWNHKGIC